MSARDVIAAALPGSWLCTAADGDAILAALTAAGYRILAPGDLDAATIEAMKSKGAIRDWDLVNGLNNGTVRLDADMKPVVVAKGWPAGCRSPNSCDRNKACMYVNCPHEGSDIATALRNMRGTNG